CSARRSPKNTDSLLARSRTRVTGPFVLLGIAGRSFFQPLRCLLVSVGYGGVESGPSFLIPDSPVSALLKEKSDNFRTTPGRGMIQRRGSAGVASVNAGALSKQPLDHERVTAQSGVVQRRCAIGVPSMNVRSMLQQNPNNAGLAL